MKRIRLFLFALVFSCCGVSFGDTNDNYTAQLSAIYSVLNIIAQDQQVLKDYALAIGEMVDVIQYSLEGGRLPDILYWTNLGNAILTLRDKVISSEAMLKFYLPLLGNIDFNIYDINHNVQTIRDDLSELDGLADSLSEIIQYVSQASSYAQQTALNTEGVATEQTLYELYQKVQEIHGMLQSIDPTSILMEIDAHLEEFIMNWQYLFNKLDVFKENYFDIWNVFFNDYKLYHGYPTLSLRYYTLNGSPLFANGYVPVPHDVNYTPNSAFEFLNYAVSLLLDVSSANNEISLFIAKYITTNGHAEVLSDFQQYSHDIISDLQADYSTLRDLAYDNTTLTFNPSTMPLGNVKALFDGLDSRGYSALRSEPVVISGFNALDPNLPSYFDFQYDLTPMQSLIEIARVVFSAIWILLFCSMFLWMCIKFRKLYNWLFSTMVSNAPNQSALTNMPI